MPAVSRASEPAAVAYVFTGPDVRRLTAEQFADAIGEITGEWNVLAGGQMGVGTGDNGRSAGGGPRTDSDPATFGTYVRDYKANSSQLTRALGRPIRDQVTSVRAADSTTPQALELVNGEILTQWLMRGARRMIGELAPEPRSLFNGSTGGRNATGRMFDADISRASRLWLIVSDTGSNAPERVLPVFVHAELAGPGGAVPLGSLTPIDGSGLRAAVSPASDRIPLKNSSRLVYDISGRGFTRFRGSVRSRQRSRGDRLDAQSLRPLLRLRCGTEHGSSAAARGGPRAARPRTGDVGSRRGRAHLLDRARPGAVCPSNARRRKRPLPIAAARSGLSPMRSPICSGRC